MAKAWHFEIRKLQVDATLTSYDYSAPVLLNSLKLFGKDRQDAQQSLAYCLHPPPHTHTPCLVTSLIHERSWYSLYTFI